MHGAKANNWLKSLTVRFTCKPAELGVVFLGDETGEKSSPGLILGTIGSSRITDVEAMRMTAQLTPEQRQSHQKIFSGGTRKSEAKES